MRGKLTAGVLMALAFLTPAAPAMAQTEPPVLNEACQTVERKVYTDIRELVTIDLDTATDVEVRVLAAQILYAANTNSLVVLPKALQEQLDGTADELRAFLKDGVRKAWAADLRLAAVRTLTGAGPNVQAAAQKALDEGTIEAHLAYLNDGLYAARALDCAAQPSPSATSQPAPTPTAQPTPTATSQPVPTSSATPSATTTTAPTPAPSASVGAPGGGEGGGLPVTGADTMTVVGVGGALLALGGAGYVIGRRRRSRFVA
ncbi:ALF repeat-containing protein [Micromonospora mirobrigensis]|uniref:LPXTG-motif cell wall anchor domain-containing protein n=1 Tax=Micromonospora mirobrigensis TaxID=262898 RepID=A0A1C4VAT6_9ACTN|nr:ALF repeat-containing protein [Micromonospora mirobrigensis]SCE81052.1 LPXTG-motif cell wall anchor domain-containing protein [Micromonospora mirobrigensis]